MTEVTSKVTAKVKPPKPAAPVMSEPKVDPVEAPKVQVVMSDDPIEIEVEAAPTLPPVAAPPAPVPAPVSVPTVKQTEPVLSARTRAEMDAGKASISQH